MIRGFKLVTRGSELVTRGLELVTRGFGLITHQMLKQLQKITDQMEKRSNCRHVH